MTAEQHEVLEAEPAAAPAGPLAGDPSTLGLIVFVPGGVTLALALTGYITLADGVAVFLFVTGLGQLITSIWAAALGQTAVAAIFGLFFSFWISLGIQITGLTHNWFGAVAPDVLEGYLISYIVIFAILTVTTLRLPLAFTAVFGLVTVTFVFVLLSVLNPETDGSVGLWSTIAGYLVFVFTAICAYILAGGFSLATGGPAMNLGKPIQR